MKETNQDM